MKRRNFLKSAVAAGSAIAVPSSLTLQSLLRPAYAAPAFDELVYSAPAVMPQVINIFLYGGPSELSANLTNIFEIDRDSQNPYPDALVDRANLGPGTGVTRNGFWANAGGNTMEFLIEQSYMTLYRTIMKRKNTSRSHRENIFMGLKGSLDIENTPGIGTRLATMLYLNATSINGVSTLADSTSVADVSNLFLPFVSFEGESTAFALDPSNPLPLRLRGLTLDTNFDNPYERNNNDNAADLDALAAKVVATYQNPRFQKAINGFTLREEMEVRIGNIQTSSGAALPLVTEVVDQANDVDANDNNRLVYPNTQFASRVRAAVTLAIENPSTVYITVGGGLGGWDDHNNGFDRYPARMNDLMATLRAAVKHIKYSGTQTAGVATTSGGLTRVTDNIVINMFGDFGRLVNRNNSNGWDHANNQNLFTFGGAGVSGLDGAGNPAARTLGKLVGTTVKQGNAGQNNQYTVPASGSYEAEPMSIAASVYGYFGARNPQVLTKDADSNPNGDVALDETAASQPIVPAPPPVP